MAKIVCLDENHSTTRLCHKLLDGSLLDEHGGIKEELKFKIDLPEFKIKNSRILGKPEDKFETMLFLPEGEGRQGEGGLRTKGYFKHSYVNCGMSHSAPSWFIVDSDGNHVMPAPAEIQQIIDLPPITHNLSPVALPLITVITVVLNGEKYLEETIQSVINQTYPNVEYIIIDGGSTDGTLGIIKKYEDYIDYWISEKDRGIYDAMNKGIKCSLGMFINLMNSDDYFFDTKVLTHFYYSMFPGTEAVDVFYGDQIIVTNYGNYIKYSASESEIETCLMNYEMPFCHQACFVRTKVYMSISLYKNDDAIFFLTICKKSLPYRKINLIVVSYREGGISYKESLRIRKERIKFLLENCDGVKYKINICSKYYFLFIRNRVSSLIKLLLPEQLVNMIKQHRYDSIYKKF